MWAVRLSAAQDNLLQAWSWATNNGDADTELKILTGFASSEMWSSFPLILPGDAALELPGAAEHPRYALALGVSAVFASSHADVDRAEELCRLALDANADLASPDWRVEQAVLAARAHIATMNGDFVAAALLHEQAAALARAGDDLADVSVELTTAVANYVLAEQGAREQSLDRLRARGAAMPGRRRCHTRSRRPGRPLRTQGRRPSRRAEAAPVPAGLPTNVERDSVLIAARLSDRASATLSPSAGSSPDRRRSGSRARNSDTCR